MCVVLYEVIRNAGMSTKTELVIFRLFFKVSSLGYAKRYKVHLAVMLITNNKCSRKNKIVNTKLHKTIIVVIIAKCKVKIAN